MSFCYAIATSAFILQSAPESLKETLFVQSFASRCWYYEGGLRSASTALAVSRASSHRYARNMHENSPLRAYAGSKTVFHGYNITVQMLRNLAVLCLYVPIYGAFKMQKNPLDRESLTASPDTKAVN